MTNSKKLNPNFVFPDGLTKRELDHIRKNAKPALSEAERYSLVKTSKSPTRRSKHAQRDYSIFEPVVEIELGTSTHEFESKGPGRYTVIQHRPWSDEYRVRTQVETTSSNPPLNYGYRTSKKLSARGARKITDSCYYMAKCKGGYQTFVTGTFSARARELIEKGQTSIQKETSRTMDTLQKIFGRGWTTSNGIRVPGHDESLPYCWVVEIPKNESGEQNPHIHMLLGWSVPFEIFGEWCKKIETVWGNGYFHLEKIRNPTCAGAYMSKAAGYLTKANNQESQGVVKGNRYGISKISRAPEWKTIERRELGIMGQLITEMHNTNTLVYGYLFEDRNRLKKALLDSKRTGKSNQYAIGSKLENVRKC